MIRAKICVCPAVETLSSLLDGEIADDTRRTIETHAASCPMCGATLREFGGLRTALGALDAASPAVDVAAFVEERLPARVASRPVSRRHPWRWQLLPAGFAAAGALVTGVYLGMLPQTGAAIGAAGSAAVAVFDSVPPGGLCAPPMCVRRGR